MEASIGQVAMVFCAKVCFLLLSPGCEQRRYSYTSVLLQIKYLDIFGYILEIAEKIVKLILKIIIWRHLI